MADETNPAAQGAAPTDSDSNPGTPSPSQENQFTGIQKRIDELTARFHDESRQRQALEQTNTQLMALLAQQRQPAQEAPPPFEIDDEEQKKMDYMIQRATMPLMQHITMLESQVAGQSVKQAVAAAGFTDPRIAQRAEQLAASWAQQGHFKNRIVTMDDAVKMAAGQVAAEEAQKASSQGRRHEFNALSMPLAPVGGPPAPTRNKEPELSYEQIEQDPSAAAAALAKKLGL